jgi:hypothetical protein
VALISAFYRCQQYREIIEFLDLDATPPAGKLLLAECHRKLGSVQFAKRLCLGLEKDETLDKEQRDYAWVIRLYCLLHAAPQDFHKEVHRCPFGHTSPHWVRFQCARVFSGVTDTSEHKKLRSLFGKTLEEPSNESQKHDLEKALQFLNAKPLARGAKCALI